MCDDDLPSNVDRPKFIVIVGDNYDYMEEGSEYELGTFRSCDQARQACRALVDRFFENPQSFNGKTVEESWKSYCSFGRDPFIVSSNGDCGFSAWTYALSTAIRVQYEISPALGERLQKALSKFDAVDTAEVDHDAVGKKQTKSHQPSSIVLSDDDVWGDLFDAFWGAVGWMLVPFDYENWDPVRDKSIAKPDFIETADLAALSKLFYFWSRARRFTWGYDVELARSKPSLMSLGLRRLHSLLNDGYSLNRERQRQNGFD